MIGHEQIMARIEAGDLRFASIERGLARVLEAVEPLPEMKRSVDATKEIVEAWDAVKTGGKFVRWASGILAGIGLIYVVVKGAILHAIESAVL